MKEGPLDIVLAGIGGYGMIYLSSLLDSPDPGRFRLAAAVDPAPERCGRLAELRALGIPVFPSLDELPAGGGRDGGETLVVISSPIHRHAGQTCLALSRGCHVLCEKPAAATVQDVDRMIAARDRAGKIAAVGYQWSFSPSIISLKRDILSGLFGRPRRLRSLCLWPRDRAYYGRNGWAGRKFGRDGAPVLDSPVNNAMAHDLHNMLFLLGDRPSLSARPVAVTAELYRANAIENFDTAALRVFTGRGAEILFYGAHPVFEERGPEFLFEFERGRVEYAGHPDPIRAFCDDGSVREYASPGSDRQERKLWTMIDAVSGDSGTAASGGRNASPAAPIPCGLEAARAQTLCVNGAQDSMPEPVDFPAPLIRVTGEGGEELRWVDGLADAFADCFEKGILPSEAGLSWARPGRTIDLGGYGRFPGG
jgi:predicted dehydrogenase